MSTGFPRPARPSRPGPSRPNSPRPHSRPPSARGGPHPLAAPLRLALVSRGVIVLAAVGAAAVYGLLEDDWSLSGTLYVAADFLFTIVACFDALRVGLYALGAHVAVSIAWLTLAVYAAPWIAQQLANMS